MPFLLMIFLVVICLPDPKDWPGIPLYGNLPAISAAATWLLALIPVLLAACMARSAIRALRQDHTDRVALARRFDRWRFRHQIVLFAAFGLALVVFGWGKTVNAFWHWGDRPLPGAELLLLSPFLASIFLSWAVFYDADRAAWQAGYGAPPLTASPDGPEP